MYKHVWTPEIGEELSVKKEPGNLHDNFGFSVVFQAELTSTPAHSAQHAPAIIRGQAFITVHDLRPPALKRDPASKRSGSYLRQYKVAVSFP